MGTERPLSIAIAALGGQGGGVLADWIIEIAERYGWLVQLTSVPGVAQRTGTTVYYLECCPRPAQGAEPILALSPSPGDVDVVVAAELMEAGRAVVRGFVTPDRTTLVASSHRVYGITEKSALGDGVADANAVLSALRSEARSLVCFDMEAIASDTGSVISSVLLGALAASGALNEGIFLQPFEQLRAVGGDDLRLRKMDVRVDESRQDQCVGEMFDRHSRGQQRRDLVCRADRVDAAVFDDDDAVFDVPITLRIAGAGRRAQEGQQPAAYRAHTELRPIVTAPARPRPARKRAQGARRSSCP